MIDTKEINEIVEIQNRQSEVRERVIPAWFRVSSESLNYPICKDGDSFVLLILHDYNPSVICKEDKVYSLLENIFEEPVKTYICLFFDMLGSFKGVKIYLPTGERFSHYHGNIGVSADYDCLGPIKKISTITELYVPENRFIESLRSGLNCIRIDSVVQNAPQNENKALCMPNIDDLKYSQEYVSVWTA